jgi:hypothetical protein
MPKIVLAAAFLALIGSHAHAATKIEIAARLIGYDLRQALGESSENTALPRVVVTSGSEELISVAREYRYPKEFNKKGKPTVMRTAYLGIRFPIYVRETEAGVRFLARVELCEREDPSNPQSVVAKVTTSFQGQMQFDRVFTTTVGAPGGRTATLEMLMTRR